MQIRIYYPEESAALCCQDLIFMQGWVFIEPQWGPIVGYGLGLGSNISTHSWVLSKPSRRVSEVGLLPSAGRVDGPENGPAGRVTARYNPAQAVPAVDYTSTVWHDPL
jgi:hypothetical protein